MFNLVLRDERFDKYFTASDYLRQHLDAVRAKRKAAGEANVQPTFADIERTHLLYLRSAYRPYVAVASEYTRVKASGSGAAPLGAAGGSCQFTFPVYGHYLSDMAIHIRFSAIGSQTATAPSALTPYLRYRAYPGLYLFRNIEFRSDNILIDNYGPDDSVAFGKFFVGDDSRVGWDRCVGQQEQREAVYNANGFTGSLLYRDGPQTPKLYQESFDMFVPLQFWFCRDAASALLNDLIPNSQRTVACELAPLADLVSALIPDPLNPGKLIPTALPFSSLGVEIELYVNSLYVNPEIHELLASRAGFSLIRVHRRQVNPLQGPAGAFLLDQLKFPAEYLCVGFRSRRLAADFDRWWLMGTPRVRTDANRLMVPAVVWNSTLAVNELVLREAAEVSTLESTIDTIGVTAHGIEIYPRLPAAFYNAYMPIRYANGTMVVSPVDSSAFFVNFCLYPGKFNPSGYYNLSAGREMYLNYTTRSASFTLGDTEMVVSMSALNFLVRRGDKLHTKYAM